MGLSVWRCPGAGGLQEGTPGDKGKKTSRGAPSKRRPSEEVGLDAFTPSLALEALRGKRESGKCKTFGIVGMLRVGAPQRCWALPRGTWSLGS